MLRALRTVRASPDSVTIALRKSSTAASAGQSPPLAPRSIRLPLSPQSPHHTRISKRVFSKMPSKNESSDKAPSNEQSKSAHPSTHQVSGSTEGKHAWKHRAPYSIHKEDDFDAKLSASCHCGQVKYQLSRDEPLDSKLCHCSTCQKQHAAPFQWAAIFHKTDINFVNGHHNLEWYDPTDKTTEHKLPCKVRCNFCHSPIMDEGRNMILLFPSMIDFESKEQKEKFKPRMHMFYGQRVVDIPDGLPKWSGLNDSSDLLADSPAEMVSKRARELMEQDQEKDESQNKKAKNGGSK